LTSSPIFNISSSITELLVYIEFVGGLFKALTVSSFPSGLTTLSTGEKLSVIFLSLLPESFSSLFPFNDVVDVAGANIADVDVADVADVDGVSFGRVNNGVDSIDMDGCGKVDDSDDRLVVDNWVDNNGLGVLCVFVAEVVDAAVVDVEVVDASVDVGIIDAEVVDVGECGDDAVLDESNASWAAEISEVSTFDFLFI